MRDSGGELKNMDAHKSYIGVINKNSKLGMDDMALAAWEAGYFDEMLLNCEQNRNVMI